jgi:hypothetical protein
MKRQIVKFLDAFIHPDREDDPERGEVAHAANLLQIGEFQLLQLAYRRAYGKDMEEAVVDRLFAAYMLHNQVPSWALRYARYIVDLERRGMLTEQDPTYHRYDSDYYTYIPAGTKKFVIATGILFVLIGGAIFVGHMSGYKATTILPPYTSEDELQPVKTQKDLKSPPPGP